jgi:hypothetical protein
MTCRGKGRWLRRPRNWTVKRIAQQHNLERNYAARISESRYDQFLDDIEYDQELDIPKWHQIKI